MRFIAWSDVRLQLRDRSTLVWLFVMPPIFFYFIGTVTGGASSAVSGTETPLIVVAESPGFLKDQIDWRLRDNDFVPEWVEALPEPDSGEEGPARTLAIEPKMTDRVLANEVVGIRYQTRAGALTRDFEEIRIQRSLYTALADIVVADAESTDGLTAGTIEAVNSATRVWQLDVSPAGERREIPSGFEQSVPGMLVMFTLLILLTSGGTMLVLERRRGLLRRLASAPITRTELVAGKWGGRMVLAAIQVVVALAIGTVLFRVDWGPDPMMVTIVLAAWAGFCASAGLWLGSIASTEAQAAGLGVLVANALAALGGCWWPIEVTPAWMQFVAKLTPTGWTMDALHRLVSFQTGAAEAVPHVVVLVLASLVVGWLAVRAFRYD